MANQNVRLDHKYQYESSKQRHLREESATNSAKAVTNVTGFVYANRVQLDLIRRSGILSSVKCHHWQDAFRVADFLLLYKLQKTTASECVNLVSHNIRISEKIGIVCKLAKWIIIYCNCSSSLVLEVNWNFQSLYILVQPFVLPN